jgi:formiminotetrahydrofolate cyclodeaminase
VSRSNEYANADGLVNDRISYSQYAVVDLLDAFASNTPAPGGGSAAALTGALGVSLLLMVAGLPRTRGGRDVPEEAADLAEASARLRPLRDRILALVDRDAQAYASIIAAFSMPKASDAEKAARQAQVQIAMHDATDVPLETMRACQQAMAGAVIVARNGLRAAASDVGTAVELLGAAARSSAMAIDANVRGIADAHYVERVIAERRQLDGDLAADAARARELIAEAGR